MLNTSVALGVTLYNSRKPSCSYLSGLCSIKLALFTKFLSFFQSSFFTFFSKSSIAFSILLIATPNSSFVFVTISSRNFFASSMAFLSSSFASFTFLLLLNLFLASAILLSNFCLSDLFTDFSNFSIASFNAFSALFTSSLDSKSVSTFSATLIASLSSFFASSILSAFRLFFAFSMVFLRFSVSISADFLNFSITSFKAVIALLSSSSVLIFASPFSAVFIAPCNSLKADFVFFPFSIFLASFIKSSSSVVTTFSTLDLPQSNLIIVTSSDLPIHLEDEP